MSDNYTDEELAQGYYLDFASALVRVRFPELAHLPLVEQVRGALKNDFRLHHFKRTGGLPRVKKTLGILQGLAPESLLDIGSGRGVFLWPLLDTFPWLTVIAIDQQTKHIEDYQAVHHGGIKQLIGLQMDVTRLALAENAVDVVTFLEVMEHLPHPLDGLREAVRIARRFVVLSVPSKKDDNPEHLHLFTRPHLQEMFAAVGIDRLSFDAVLNHTLVVAKIPS